MASKCTVVPDTVHTAGVLELKLTGSPEEEEAWITKSRIAERMVRERPETDGLRLRWRELEIEHQGVVIGRAVGRGAVEVLCLELGVVVDHRGFIGVDGPVGGLEHTRG